MQKTLLAAALLASAFTASALAQPAGDAVKIYAAAVVKTPLTAIAADYEKSTGHKVTVIYDTAGAADQRFRADPAADILITNILLIQNEERAGVLKDGTSIALGGTVASIAVPPGSKKPDVSNPDALKAALLSAKTIAVSDPARGATVGTHFMKVIEQLGVKDQVMPKVTLSKDGVETVNLVLEGKADIGVSQSSEILQGSPAAMAGPFPKELALSTDFSLWHRNAARAEVKDFVTVLTSKAGRDKLAADGVMPPAAR